MFHRESIVAVFCHKRIAAFVEVRRVIEIVIAECLYANILHSRRYIHLATPYPRTLSIFLHALHTLYGVTPCQARKFKIDGIIKKN